MPHAGPTRPRRAPFRLVRVVRAGDLYPRGYGLAWARWQADECVALPIPLNVLAGLARRGWFWFKRGGVALPNDPAEAYAAGYRHGLGWASGWLGSEES